MPARSFCAWLLLAVFAAGGAVAPSVHRVQHGSERAAWLADHVGTAGHHHDAPGMRHGDETQRSCPTAPAVDWQCTLCHGVSASLVAVAVVIAPRATSWRPSPARTVWRSAPADASTHSRGPPQV